MNRPDRFTLPGTRTRQPARLTSSSIIAQALNNTYWLRDKIRSLVDVEIWIVPVIVFTNAFVERTAPVKGVRTISKKFLLDLLQTSKAQNLAVWEKREKIRSARNACG